MVGEFQFQTEVESGRKAVDLIEAGRPPLLVRLFRLGDFFVDGLAAGEAFGGVVPVRNSLLTQFPAQQHDWPSTLQGKSSNPISRSFTWTPVASISASVSFTRGIVFSRSALRRAIWTTLTSKPP